MTTKEELKQEIAEEFEKRLANGWVEASIDYESTMEEMWEFVLSCVDKATTLADEECMEIARSMKLPSDTKMYTNREAAQTMMAEHIAQVIKHRHD